MPDTGPGSQAPRFSRWRRRRRSFDRLTNVPGRDRAPDAPVSDPISPAGFRRVEGGRLAMVGDVAEIRSDTPDLVDSIHRVVANHQLDLFGSGVGVVLPDTVGVRPRVPTTELIAQLRPYAGVVVHPALAETRSEEAALILNLAKAGVPMAGTLSPEVQSVLPSGIGDVVLAAEIDDLADSEARERLSVRLRRVAWSGGFPTPPVSVVVTSNRPTFLGHVRAQLEAFDYPDLEIVLVAHGFPPGDDAPNPAGMQSIHVPAAVPFGEALNAGFAASNGEVVTKMDDDDWYAPEHLADLVCALHYSNAPLVAKAAEFVYLEELDITIRRMVNGSETYGNRNVAGGAFLMSRDLFDEVGGWRPLSRHVDQALLDDLERSGATWYRTHGFGYVLHRRPSGHTWDASVDYFLDGSEAQYRGLERRASLLDERGRYPAGQDR